MREEAITGRRVVLIDVVTDPEAVLAVQEASPLLRTERFEGRVGEIERCGVEVGAHRLKPRRIPFAPVRDVPPVGGAVTVGNEPAVGELVRPAELRIPREARAAERSQILVEVRAEPKREALDGARRALAGAVLLEAALGIAGARPDVDPGEARVAATAGIGSELDHVDARGHRRLIRRCRESASSR
jgi:hypothetical protein